MREGVLYDMLGRGGADDPRDASVAALMQRYGIDEGQARAWKAPCCACSTKSPAPGRWTPTTA